jgi:hypothetical protein
MTYISSLSTHRISSGNSTTALLGASATFTGVWEDITNYASAAVAILGSVQTSGTLYFDLSTDGGATFTSVPSTVGDTTFAVPRILNVVETHIRIRYINNGVAQTGTFSIQTKYSNAQELGLLSSVDGVVNNETPTQVNKSIIAGEVLNDDLTSSGNYSNASLLSNKALKVATPPTVLYQVKRPTDPSIPTGSAITIDPVLNVEANVVDSGWIPVTAYGGGSLINIISDTTLQVYVLNASDDQGNNMQGSLNPTLVTVPTLSATIGAPFFDDYFRIVVVNSSGVSSDEYSVRAEGGQTPAPPVFTSLNQQTFRFFPAPLSRVVNSPQQDRNFGYIGDQQSIRFEGINETVGAGSFESIWRGTGNYVFPTTAETFGIAAGGNANDDAAGTGARSVKITFLDSNWNVTEETLATAGASASAATSVTGYRIIKAEVVEVGTYGGSNTGDIQIENTTSNQIVGFIAAGTGVAQQAVYTVPANKTLYIEVIDVSVGQSDSADVRMIATCQADDFTAPYCASRFEWGVEDYAGSASFTRRTFLKFPEKTDLIMEAQRQTGSGTARVGVDVECILVDD